MAALVVVAVVVVVGEVVTVEVLLVRVTLTKVTTPLLAVTGALVVAAAGTTGKSCSTSVISPLLSLGTLSQTLSVINEILTQSSNTLRQVYTNSQSKCFSIRNKIVTYTIMKALTPIIK